MDGKVLFFTGASRDAVVSARREEIDAAMLDSLATSFQMWEDGHEFMISFNRQDVADLLRRARERAERTKT